MLPPSQFCRGECCNDYELFDDMYVVHAGGGGIGDTAGKISHMASKGVWFLRHDWQQVLNESLANGVHGLEQLST